MDWGESGDHTHSVEIPSESNLILSMIFIRNNDIWTNIKSLRYDHMNYEHRALKKQ